MSYPVIFQRNPWWEGRKRTTHDTNDASCKVSNSKLILTFPQPSHVIIVIQTVIALVTEAHAPQDVLREPGLYGFFFFHFRRRQGGLKQFQIAGWEVGI